MSGKINELVGGGGLYMNVDIKLNENTDGEAGTCSTQEKTWCQTGSLLKLQRIETGGLH